MVKKILVGFILAVFISSCFAAYSGGGRSGFSGGGSRGYSSVRSSSYSSGRSGYIRTRTYSSPRYRSYSRPYSHTVINNHHYSHGGYGGWGGFGGGGFFSGFLGGYLGGSMANNHNSVVVAGGAPMVNEGMGQGALIDRGSYVTNSGNSMGFIVSIIVMVLAGCGIIFVFKLLFIDERCSHKRDRW